MKYAENNRISHRQLYRQIILTYLSIFLICIPGRNGLQGMTGAAEILLAQLLLFLYVFFLMRTAHGYADPIRTMGKFRGILFGAFYLFYLVLTGAYILTLIEKIVPVWLISGVSGKWLTLLAVFVCCYGMNRGMQRRGRIAEVSGGIFLTGIAVMLILCVGQGKVEYLIEMKNAETIRAGRMFENIYDVLCAFSGIGLLPFAMDNVEKKGSAGKTVMLAILTVGGILCAVLILLPAVLGWKRFCAEKTPILPLLAGADLPGNVLARFDVLWMGFLLFGIFFALGSVFHYGSQILDSIHLAGGKYWVPAVVYLLSWQSEFSIEDFYRIYLRRIFVPGLLLIQIYMLMRGRQKRRKKVTAVSLLMLMLFSFAGCAGIEPEKRMYPLAMGIDVMDGDYDYVVTYGMPDLPKATGQGKEDEGKNPAVLTIQGEDFKEIEKLYERSQEKYLDIGHLQVLILGKNLLNSAKWESLLQYLKEEPLAGENIYLFQTETPESVINWDSGGTSTGEYLKGLLENRLSGQQKEGITLRQVYHQWYENRTIPNLPEIVLNDEGIQVLNLNISGARSE